MVFAPPTAQLGSAGWAVGIGIQALSLAGWAAFLLAGQLMDTDPDASDDWYDRARERGIG